MKGMKGKLLKKLKSIKPISQLKQDRVLLVNAADGFVETLSKLPIFKPPKREENVDIIDVAELMMDLEDEDKENQLENFKDDKENVEPPVNHFTETVRCGSRQSAAPLSEIEFRRPDLNSGTLFDPNLLAAFEQAIKQHITISTAEAAPVRQSRIEFIDQEKQAVIEDEGPPQKTRRIGKEDEEEDPLVGFEDRCPPGGSDAVILYSTTLRGIRKTFEDCNSIRFLLESFRVIFYERDVSMHTEYKEELWRVLDGKVMPPRLFIKGKYIGGAGEVLRLHEQGKFKILFEGIPVDRSARRCEGCSGFRFVLCYNCNGSHKVIEDDGVSTKCLLCNENGLIICPLCC